MSSTQPTVKLKAAEITDVGVVRDHNEDSGYVDPQLEYFIVADGMGGHAAGEVASAMAVEQVSAALSAHRDLLSAFAAHPTDEDRRKVVALLEDAVRAAHQAVFSRGIKEADKQGMGTTLDVLLVSGCEAFIAHVGDSRTYLLRDGKASQITTDHTVAEVLVIEGKLSVEEAQASPLRTILVNAIGVSPDVGVEISHVKLRTGDRLLLCSDGLHDYFPSDVELASYLQEDDIHTALEKLVDTAKQRGGHDNITGILVEVIECRPASGAEVIDAGLSDGVPREIGSAETMPVDASGATPTAPEAQDAGSAAGAGAESAGASGESAEDGAESAEEGADSARAGAESAEDGADSARADAESAEAGDAAPAADASSDAEPEAPSRKRRRGRKSRQTLPLGAKALDPAGGPAGDDADGAAPDDDAVRKTEPMATVAPDADPD
ncbi:MAG: serine/threonine-protein phosphatase [Deltaproteobacteria bacterium]|nr:MAG: serine/threonine-protein phosphatase [Deltaproteobacteria bacterium]